MSKGPRSHHRCHNWFNWFFMINIIIASGVMGLYWVDALTELKTVVGATNLSVLFSAIYFVFSFCVQITVFSLFCIVVYFSLAWIIRWKHFCVMWAALCGALLMGVVVGDALSYRTYHMHYGFLAWEIYKANAFSAVLAFNIKEYSTLLALLGALFAAEWILAMRLWHYFSKRSVARSRMLIAFFLCMASIWIVVYTVFAVASLGQWFPPAYRYAILRVGNIAPYLSPFYRFLAPSDPLSELHYPLRPIHYDAPAEKLNVVIIGIDAWRYDAMTEAISPSIYRFSKKSSVFKRHYTGGNCTQSGLFSLFYAIPPNYWDVFLRQERGPVFLDTLNQQRYDIGIFMSAPINFPQFDKTIFVGVENLSKSIPGSTSMERDRHMTQQAVQFFEQQQKSVQPFFAFLFYDTLHNYCESDRPEYNPFRPFTQSCNRFLLAATTNPTPYLNLYYNKVHYVDEQVDQVLRALEKQHLLERTIVVITADHGEQMNDQHRGFWGHASAYNEYQLHVPMIVFWPGRAPTTVTEMTTHYDLVPTLMQEVLGVTNTASDYSVGENLFTSHRLLYYIAASYGDYAILHHGGVLRIYPDGDYKILDHRIDSRIIAAVQRQLHIFFEGSQSR